MNIYLKTNKELKQICKNLKLHKYSQLNKSELVNLISSIKNPYIVKSISGVFYLSYFIINDKKILILGEKHIKEELYKNTSYNIIDYIYDTIKYSDTKFEFYVEHPYDIYNTRKFKYNSQSYLFELYYMDEIYKLLNNISYNLIDIRHIINNGIKITEPFNKYKKIFNNKYSLKLGKNFKNVIQFMSGEKYEYIIKYLTKKY